MGQNHGNNCRFPDFPVKPLLLGVAPPPNSSCPTLSIGCSSESAAVLVTIAEAKTATMALIVHTDLSDPFSLPTAQTLFRDPAHAYRICKPSVHCMPQPAWRIQFLSSPSIHHPLDLVHDQTGTLEPYQKLVRFDPLHSINY